MKLLEDLADRARTSSTIADVSALLGDAARELGFHYHALVEHADLARPPPQYLFLQNYPPGWVEKFAKAGLHRYDPAQCLAARRHGGFAWAEIPRYLQLTNRQVRIIDEAHEAGLGEGFTVPLHVAGARGASCSFATRPGTPLPREALLSAELLAHVIFSAVHDILRGPPVAAPPHLSRRERECVVLMCQGKTDWEIATIIGIGEETVTTYLKAARRKFGLSRRTQLAIAAVCHGLVSLEEVTSWQ